MSIIVTDIDYYIITLQIDGLRIFQVVPDIDYIIMLKIKVVEQKFRIIEQWELLYKLASSCHKMQNTVLNTSLNTKKMEINIL